MLRDRKEMDVKNKMHHVEVWGGIFLVVFCLVFKYVYLTLDKENGESCTKSLHSVAFIRRSKL